MTTTPTGRGPFVRPSTMSEAPNEQAAAEVIGNLKNASIQWDHDMIAAELETAIQGRKLAQIVRLEAIAQDTPAGRIAEVRALRAIEECTVLIDCLLDKLSEIRIR